MAILYWAKLPEHTDIFTQGYVGVTTNISKRTRGHRHKFKSVKESLIIQPVLIADTKYCYEIEEKLRPTKNIGWNKSVGGYKNNVMFGKENPNYNKLGKSAPHFKGWFVTPVGTFDRAEDAAKQLNCSVSAIQRKCCGRTIGDKKLPPQNGFAFVRKG